MVAITIDCFDTKHPTYAPSVAPTTPAPTLAPTELCSAVEVTASGTNAVETYNGVYNKQASTIIGLSNRKKPGQKLSNRKV